VLLIRPVTITPGMVTASNAGAADPAYAATASYALGQRVYLEATGKTYECVQAPALGKYPPAEPLYWMAAAPSNRWSMFDGGIGASTVTEGDLLASITIPGRINAVAFFGLIGSRIRLTQRSAEGAVLSTFDRPLRADPADWYGYFFAEPEQVTDVVFTALAPSSGSRLEITVTGPAACAAVVAGNTFDLGGAQWGAATSIIDYSRKNISADGIQTFERGRFSRRLNVMLEQPRSRYPAVQRALEAVRATPCVWLGMPGSGDYSPMTIYGYYRDFSIEVTYPAWNLCSLEIESLT
jgi:hypothetical protein